MRRPGEGAAGAGREGRVAPSEPAGAGAEAGAPVAGPEAPSRLVRDRPGSPRGSARSHEPGRLAAPPRAGADPESRHSAAMPSAAADRIRAAQNLNSGILP